MNTNNRKGHRLFLPGLRLILGCICISIVPAPDIFDSPRHDNLPYLGRQIPQIVESTVRHVEAGTTCRALFMCPVHSMRLGLSQHPHVLPTDDVQAQEGLCISHMCNFSKVPPLFAPATQQHLPFELRPKQPLKIVRQGAADQKMPDPPSILGGSHTRLPHPQTPKPIRGCPLSYLNGRWYFCFPFSEPSDILSLSSHRR